MSRLLLILLLTWHSSGVAKSLEDLLQSGELEVNSWIEPATGVVVGQELQLTVEIATQRWFAGGTRLKLPEAPGLVALRRDQFANNLNRNSGGNSWVVQRLVIQLYAQREGDFSVPGIALELAVNDAEAGIVRGKTTTEPLFFRATRPPGLGAQDRWVAAPQFSLKLSTDRDLQQLSPGDAFTVDIAMQASDLEAMMLPELSLPEFDGLAVYPEPPELTNSSNRGTASALRRQRFTYVVEQPGQYQIEAQQLYWWDTVNAELRTLTTPALSVDAGAAAAAAAASPGLAAATSGWRPEWRTVLALLATLGLALVTWRAKARSQQSNAANWYQAQHALRRGEASAAAQSFYQWLNGSRPQPNWYSLRRSVGSHASDDAQRLLSAAYSSRPQPLPDRLQVATGRNRKWWQRWLPAPIRLPLNPDNSAAAQKASE